MKGSAVCLRDDAGRRLRQGARSLDHPRAPREGHVRLRRQVPQHANSNANSTANVCRGFTFRSHVRLLLCDAIFDDVVVMLISGANVLHLLPQALP